MCLIGIAVLRMTTYCPDKKFDVKTYIAPCHLQTWLLNIVNGFETKTLVVFGSLALSCYLVRGPDTFAN